MDFEEIHFVPNVYKSRIGIPPPLNCNIPRSPIQRKEHLIPKLISILYLYL
jgi:hypothetical protein